ncbi:MAG TPA: FAD-dependent oxidoreductase [Myxococcota bacterium]|nr:FAD-dependent oxidoreductase [Myxococcota bacterium]
MRRDLAALADREHDLVVVGGGIHGVCAAYDAAARGLSVALVERGDFGSGTSSQSLRVIHGGIRYLQHADLRRALESLRDQHALLAIAPHLVEPLGTALPTRGAGARSRVLLGAGLAAFEALRALVPGPQDAARRPPRGGLVSRESLLALAPGLRSEGVTGAAIWWDAQAWSSERLLLAFLRAAVEAGATVANHAPVERVLVRGGRAEGVRASDAESGEAIDVRARCVLCCVGPWTDVVASTLGRSLPERHFPLSKALNLVVRRPPPRLAIALEGPPGFVDRDAVLRSGSRLLFAVPWRGLTLLGTKHVPWSGDPEGFALGEEDVDGLLADANAAWPGAAFRREDVVGALGGMLPRRRGTRPDEAVQLEKAETLVDHGKSDGVEGLLSLVAVKWTTARSVAAWAVDAVVRRLGRGGASTTRARPLPGGAIEDFEALRRETLAAPRRAGLAPETEEALLRAYGRLAGEVRSLAEAEPGLAAPLVPGSSVVGAQLVHAARDEMAIHLDDALLRRTELYLAAPLPREVLERAAALVGGELGWSEARRGAEVARADAALRRFTRS